MRLKLTFKLKDKYFPIEYRRIILSFIKKSVTECNSGKYFEELFTGTNEKGYCFSVILPKCKYTKEKIILEENEIKVLFSTEENSREEFILFSSFISQKNKVFPLKDENLMTLVNISKLNKSEIYNSRAIFKTTLGSSICVREHIRETNKDNYYVFNDKDFREKLKVVITNQLMKKGFRSEEIDEFKINPIECRKVVVKNYSRYVDSTIGTFEINATKEILQYLYDIGIGSRTSMGFGMIDLITQDLV